MKKYDVFISYSSYDQKVVEGLCAYLEQYKIRCFVAYRDIPRGVVWARAIVEALDESSMMVVVFSDHFNNSDQVDREIELASEDRKPILTFRITDDAFKGAKKYYLKNLNWIDAFPNPNKVFGSVLESVVRLLKLEDSSSADTSAELINNGETQESAERKAREAREEAKRKAREEVEQRMLAESKGRNGVYQVGDYYNRDGKQGVVFEVWDNGRHGKIISLDQTQTCWDQRNIDGRDRTYARSEGDGKANTDKIMSRSDSEYFDAFEWCRAKGEEWYLPSKDELRVVSDNISKINATLKQFKRVELGGWYWSSTEDDAFCAWVVLMNYGSTSYNFKNGRFYVRAVSAF